jgi:hypothetical protein
MKGHWRDRDTRPAMLLPAVQARRLSTRLSFSKSVPCDIIVSATGIVLATGPGKDYLKHKVFSVGASTRVMALSEKNLVASNSRAALCIFRPFAEQEGRARCGVVTLSMAAAGSAFDASISLWLKYIHRQPTTDPPMTV